MHLNNRGWGTRDMIIMTSFLVIMLLISWYFITTMLSGVFNQKVNTPSSDYYNAVQNNLKTSAEKYYYDNNIQGQMIISYDYLKDNGYISNVRDFLEASCTGYVIVNNNVFKPFIRCNGYTSPGYEKDFE